MRNDCKVLSAQFPANNIRLLIRTWSNAIICWCCLLRHYLIYAILIATSCRMTAASEAQLEIPVQVQRQLELENWSAVLEMMSADLLTNSISRLVVVRALFETGRLPDELFAWIHGSGPELLSTTELKQHMGTACVAETLLRLGHLNAAERLAFNSLEMEGETPLVLRTLARLHIVKGLTNAANIFLNRLQSIPEQSTWALNIRSGLASNNIGHSDTVISQILTNLITRDGIVNELTTERLLRQALDANPSNSMAFHFLMAHQLMERQLVVARRTLATYPQASKGPLPRHYSEAILLLGSLHPELTLSSFLSRMPKEMVTKFNSFSQTMNRLKDSREQLQAEIWRNYGNTYWYYYFFGQLHKPGTGSRPEKP